MPSPRRRRLKRALRRNWGKVAPAAKAAPVAAPVKEEPVLAVEEPVVKEEKKAAPKAAPKKAKK